MAAKKQQVPEETAAQASATMEAPGPKPGEWAVYDMNARQAPRKHEPVLGHVYALSADKPTYMPQQHAVAFLSDSAFVVVNEEKQKVAALPEAAVERAGTDRPQFRPGEVIAKYDELRKDSLLVRAQRRPGGERFNKNTPVQTIIDFLMNAEQQRSGSGDGIAEDADAENIPPDEAGRILGSD